MGPPRDAPLDDEQIRNIVFNETQSLSGDDLPAARVQIAQAIMNADTRWGPLRTKHAGTAPSYIEHAPDPRQQGILSDVAAAVIMARTLHMIGIDTVNGATNYNLRTMESSRPPSWGKTFTLEKSWGPFQDSVGSPKHIHIWQNR